ncbi:MAG: hypothetical protein GY799_31940 [Desulfobulbaceae bacterium]|nr:hypothetical protein [Desulfobulbaceae bacterium]
MFKIAYLFGFFIVMTSVSGFAGEKQQGDMTLRLKCNIAFSNFDNIEQALTSAVIVLSDIKHKPGGAVLVSQTAGYQFWAMTHSVQSINGQQFVNNFQVAIQHKNSKLFAHALSDSSYTPERGPRHARVSQVEYHPDSFLEKGELSFECSTSP